MWTLQFRELMGYQKACRKAESGAGSGQGSDSPAKQLMGQCWATASQKGIWKNIANSSIPSVGTELSWSLWVKTPFFLACLQIDKVVENRINTWMFWVRPNSDLLVKTVLPMFGRFPCLLLRKGRWFWDEEGCWKWLKIIWLFLC